jgi:hypothetical protein
LVRGTKAWQLPNVARRTIAAGRDTDWSARTGTRNGPAVYRQADRACPDLRRPSCHRHREHAPAQRAARIAAAADRHRRCAQSHKPLDLRSTGGARHARRVGGTAVPRGPNGNPARQGRPFPPRRQLWPLARAQAAYGARADQTGPRIDAGSCFVRRQMGAYHRLAGRSGPPVLQQSSVGERAFDARRAAAA